MAVWTEINSFLLLTRPQGSQRCQKPHINILQINLLSSCAKIEPKLSKLEKPSKLKNNCQKSAFSYSFSNFILKYISRSLMGNDFGTGRTEGISSFGLINTIK